MRVSSRPAARGGGAGRREGCGGARGTGVGRGPRQEEQVEGILLVLGAVAGAEGRDGEHPNGPHALRGRLCVCASRISACNKAGGSGGAICRWW